MPALEGAAAPVTGAFTGAAPSGQALSSKEDEHTEGIYISPLAVASVQECSLFKELRLVNL